MPAKGFHQFVSRISRNFAATLSSPDCGSELNLGQRQDSKLMPRVASGEAKQSICTRLVHVELDEGTRFQVVKRQSSTPFPQNGGGQWLAFNVNRMEIRISLRQPQPLLHLWHQSV